MLLLVATTAYLFFTNKGINKELDEVQTKENSLRKDLVYTSDRISSLNYSIPDKRIELEKLKSTLIETKKNLDPSKVKPLTGYTVKSYSTRKGNHTYSRNYIYYK